MNEANAIQRGYSLIEMLIAVALLAAIAAALAPSVHASIRASTRVTAAASAAENARVGYDVLNDLFSSMIEIGSNAPTPSFKGDARTIDLTILSNIETGAQQVRLEIKNGLLFLRLPAGLSGTTVSDPENEIQILKNAARFRFYGRETPTTPIGWSNEWRGTNLPSLVRIDVDDTKSNGDTPQITFNIAASAPLHCEFDQVSRQCRR